jgi:hypothetical protein
MVLARRGPAVRELSVPVFGAFIGLPFFLDFAPLHGPARDCLLSRTFFFVSTWTWYQWVGVFAPLAVLWWFSEAKPRSTLPAFRMLARTLIPFGLVFTAAAVMLAIPVRLETFNRLQPMRSFHLLYVIFFLLLGGLIGEYGIKTSAWRWVAFLVPLALVMVLVQETTFPASEHVEWPGTNRGNTWISAFLWIRDHTPKGAVFALDPNYMTQPGEDAHGFRAVAERSVLADNVKDSGAVSLFPQLAKEWESQVGAGRGFDHFQLEDWRKLAERYPVTWILTARPGPTGLTCPYENRDFAVCRM